MNPRSHTFSHASCWLHVFAFSFDWSTELCVPFVIGQSDNFGFGLRQLINNLMFINDCRTCLVLQFIKFKELTMQYSFTWRQWFTSVNVAAFLSLQMETILFVFVDIWSANICHIHHLCDPG